MKNILILTDFSTNSWNSIKYALALFNNESCNFYLLNGMNRYEKEFREMTYSRGGLFKEDKIKNSKDELDKLIAKIASSPLSGNHKFNAISTESDIIDASRIQIAEKKIDLVVIGTNGMSTDGNKNNISLISEDIIKKLKCSILMVPNEARFYNFKEIVFPTDYTDFNEAKLLQNITELLNSHESSIRFFYMAKKTKEMNKEQQWNKETLHDYFLNQPHSFHTDVNKNFELSIDNFIEKNNINLIAMAAKNLHLFEQILFRPQSKNIKYYFKTPFLVLH